MTKTISVNDRVTILALPDHDKEVICDAYRAYKQESEGYAYLRVAGSALPIALMCAMWWFVNSDLMAGMSNQLPSVFGFDSLSLLKRIAQLGTLLAVAILAIEILNARKISKDNQIAIKEARALGVDVATIDAWLLNQIENDVAKKLEPKPIKIPVEFEGQEWQYKFNPDAYFKYRSGFLSWMSCVKENAQVYSSYFDAVRNGSRIDSQQLWRDLNQTPLKSFAWGAMGLVFFFVAPMIGIWLDDWWWRALLLLSLFVSIVFMLRLYGYIGRSELSRSDSYSRAIRDWAKYHPEIATFAAQNGLYGACSSIEFYLLRDYVHTVRAEIFRARQVNPKPNVPD